MKHLGKLLAVLFAVGLVTFGCKPETTVNPSKGNSPEAGLAGDDPHDRPAPQCMASVYTPLIDAAGNLQGGGGDAGVSAFGTLEIVNSPTHLWVMANMGAAWWSSAAHVWAGPCGTEPLNQDGTVNWRTGFPAGGTSPNTQYFSWSMPYSSLMLDANGCACMVVVMEIVQADLFGGVYNSTVVWGKGTRTAGTNGRAIDVCPVQCPYLEAGECYDLNRAAGRNCVDLNVTCTTAGEPGAAPFTFTWKDASGAVVFTDVNNTGVSTYNACPTGTSGVANYTVSVSDSRSIYSDKINVAVNLTPTCTPPCMVPVVGPSASLASWDCGQTNQGEQKVNVCHLPPGNPENRQMICIAVSALPAHIIDFKPQSQPCMGHSPGCHIGPCDPCGPHTSDDAIARAAAYRQQYGCQGN